MKKSSERRLGLINPYKVWVPDKFLCLAEKLERSNIFIKQLYYDSSLYVIETSKSI